MSYRPRSTATSTRSAVVELFASAKRPIIYSGGGVIDSGPGEARCRARPGQPRRLADHLDADGARRLSGDRRCGSACSASPAPTRPAWPCARPATSCCVSARFDDRITRGRLNAFSRPAREDHVDVDPSSISKNVHVDMGILGDVGQVLEDFVRLWQGKRQGRQKALYPWWEQIARWRARDSLQAQRRRHHAAYAVQRIRAPPRTWTPTSPPRSASIRCGPRNDSASRKPNR